MEDNERTEIAHCHGCGKVTRQKKDGVCPFCSFVNKGRHDKIQPIREGATVFWCRECGENAILDLTFLRI